MPQPNFQIIQARRFGQPVIILVDAGLDVTRDAGRFPYLLTIHAPMRNPNAMGVSSPAESERLDEVEDRLLAGLGDDEYRFAGHVTGNGRREVMIYVADPDRVLERLAGRLAEIGSPDTKVEKVHDPNWEHYLQFRA